MHLSLCFYIFNIVVINQNLLTDSRKMTTKVKEMPVVSKMFCSSNQVVLVVRSRPHVVGGGGFVVTDLGSHEVVFRVDGCGVLGKKDQMTLTDAYQNPLLLIRLKVNSYPTILTNKNAASIHFRVLHEFFFM